MEKKRRLRKVGVVMSKKSSAKVESPFDVALKEAGKSPNTIQLYARIVANFLTWVKENGGDPERLTRADVQQWVNHLVREKNKASTIENKFNSIIAYAAHLNRHDIVEGIRRPEVRKVRHLSPKSLERTELNRLLREVERDGKPRNIAITYMLTYCGLRVSELVSLDRDDVKMSDRKGTVTIREGKGSVARQVPIPPEARHHLRKYLATREDEDPALFLSNYRRRISVRSVQTMLSKYGVHPHQLRHTFGRTLTAKGIDIAIIAELMGHSDINVTRRYAKPSQEELEKAMEMAFMD
jgi:integrase/recombinase XerD